MKNIVLFATLLFISNSKAYSAFRTLEADYITNVFSQSNFLKNPNARVNTQSVTPSTGFTVSRAIITPLYDTSEFNLSSTSATGTIDWATRPFDAGMKGQNCEARFTYRGFTGGTTKAQVVQGANTVATLDLLSSTDPKQVSINFPCGDLTQATSFRISRTIATLSGTNEIGGIYVGLATNMANVAQAEFVGGGEWGAVTFTRSSTAIQSTFAAFTAGAAGTATGKATSAGSDTTVTFPYLPAGQYKVSSNFYAYAYNVTVSLTDCQFSLQEIDSNTFSGLTASGAHTTTGIYPQAGQLQGNFNFTSGGQRRFRLVSRNQSANGAASTCNAIGDAAVKSGISVYRFPSSSELVVKPENQENYWAAMRQADYYDAVGGVTSSSYVQYPVIDSVNRTFYGKASADTNDFFVLTVPSLPVGNYKVSFKGQMVGSTSTTLCAWALHDGTGLITAQEFIGAQYIPLVSAVYKNIKIESKTFALWAKRISGTGECIVQDETEVLFTLEPLDGKSTSALYVQGPVLGAQTGAAIPSGYVGEAIASQTSFLTGQSQGVWKTGTGITLQPGVYLVDMKSRTTLVAATSIQCALTKTVNGSEINDDRSFPTSFMVNDQANTINAKDCRSSGYFTLTSAMTIYPTMLVSTPISSGYRFDYWISAIRIN